MPAVRDRIERRSSSDPTGRIDPPTSAVEMAAMFRLSLGRTLSPPGRGAFGATTGGVMALPSDRAPARPPVLVSARAGFPAALVGLCHLLELATRTKCPA